MQTSFVFVDDDTHFFVQEGSEDQIALAAAMQSSTSVYSVEQSRLLGAASSANGVRELSNMIEQSVANASQRTFQQQGLSLFDILHTTDESRRNVSAEALFCGYESSARQLGLNMAMAVPDWMRKIGDRITPTTLVATAKGSLFDTTKVSSTRGHRKTTNNLLSSETGGTSILHRDEADRPGLSEEEIIAWQESKMPAVEVETNAVSRNTEIVEVDTGVLPNVVAQGALSVEEGDEFDPSALTPPAFAIRQESVSQADYSRLTSFSLPRAKLFSHSVAPHPASASNMLKRVERAALSSSGAVPVINVDTGKEENVQGSLKQQKCA